MTGDEHEPGPEGAGPTPPSSSESYELPTHDSGRALITDPSALEEMLDDEDVERALRHLK